MCINHRQLDPRARRRMIIANLSLILGMLLWNAVRWNWIHVSSPFERNWLDAIRGFLFGLYIAISLFGLRSARRCDAADSVKL
jgi:hypothetical protein